MRVISGADDTRDCRGRQTNTRICGPWDRAGSALTGWERNVQQEVRVSGLLLTGPDLQRAGLGCPMSGGLSQTAEWPSQAGQCSSAPTATVAKRAEGQLGSRMDETSARILSYSWHWSFCRDKERSLRWEGRRGEKAWWPDQKQESKPPWHRHGAILSGQLGLQGQHRLARGQGVQGPRVGTTYAKDSQQFPGCPCLGKPWTTVHLDKRKTGPALLWLQELGQCLPPTDALHHHGCSLAVCTLEMTMN